MVKTLPNTLLGLLLLFTVCEVKAQDTTATQAVDTSYKFPKAILVQLRSEHNRIEALTKARRYKELELVEEDAAKIRKKEIADFIASTDDYVEYYIRINGPSEFVVTGNESGTFIFSQTWPDRFQIEQVVI